MRRALPLLTACLLGCNALLGLDFDPRDPGAATPEEDGGSESGGDGGGSGGEGGRTDARSTTDAPPLSLEDEQIRLAALRTRVADAPPAIDAWMTTRSWIWKVKLDPTWEALKPPGAETRGSNFVVTAANDTHVVTGRANEDQVIRNAATGATVATYTRGYPPAIALDDQILFFEDAASGKDVLSWKASAPTTRTKIGNIGAVSGIALGNDDHAVWVRDVTDATKLWVVDVKKSPAVFSVTKDVQPQHATATGDGIVLTHVAGATMLFQLLGPSGPVDLTAEINVAACIVPQEDRKAFMSPPVGYGPWLIYVSTGGLLAYRHADKTLVPIQVRRSTESWVHDSPRLLRGSKLLAFAIGSEAQRGLYTIPLDSVLPP